MNEKNVKIKILTDGSQAKKEIKEVNKGLEETHETATNLFSGINLANITSLISTFKNLKNTVENLTKKSADYIETLNVLDVAYNGNTKVAKNWADTVSQTLNLDDSTLIKAASSFKVLSQSMGYSDEVGTKFSKTLSQMTLDISSLYNMDFGRAQSALQYAIQGQGKTLKATTGASVLESTVQNQLDGLGIKAEVSAMTDAEKAMARLIAIMNQLKSSQGDLARTIESPANQFRVLSEQVHLLARNIGNILLPTIANLLPYLNGILIAINTILSALSKIVGFSTDKWDFGVSTEAFKDLDTAIGGVGTTAGSTKKALMGLRGFDKLNVIKSPTPTSGSGGGAGGGGGINPNLLKAFDNMFGNYDDKLKGIRTKATKISEDILKWLNFTKQINPETGEIEWKFQGIKGLLKNVITSFSKLPLLAKVLLGLGLAAAISGLIGKFKVLLPIIKTTNSQFKTLFNSLKQGNNQFKWASSETTKLTSIMGKAKTAALGLGVAILGIGLSVDGFKKIKEEGANLINVFESLGGVIASTAGAALAGFAIGGPVGAGIGAVVGLLTSVVTGLIAYRDALTPAEQKIKNVTDATKDLNKELKEQASSSELLLTSQLIQSQKYEDYVDELNQIVDANGRVKAGYEERANFIVNELNSAYGTEMKLTDGIISNYQEQIAQIKKLIVQQEQEYYLEKMLADADSAREIKAKAIKKQEEAIKLVNEAYIKQQNALNKVNETKDKMKELDKEFTDKTSPEYIRQMNALSLELSENKSAYMKQTEALEETQKAYNKTAETIKNADERIQTYEDTKAAALAGNNEKVKEGIEKVKNSYIDANGKIRTSSEETTNVLIGDRAKELENLKNNNNEKYNETVAALTNQTKAVKNLSPKQIAEWAALATADKDKFTEKINELPNDIRKTLLSKLNEVGLDMSKEIQKGADKKKPNIEVKTNADTKGLSKDMNDYVKKNSKSFKSIGLTPFTFLPIYNTPQYANGGLPSVGQMFIANERGPELVGQIGGQSFVANQNQMMDIIDKKIGKASGTNNATFIIQVGNEEIARKVVKDLNGMARDNGKPIVIGG